MAGKYIKSSNSKSGFSSRAFLTNKILASLTPYSLAFWASSTVNSSSIINALIPLAFKFSLTLLLTLFWILFDVSLLLQYVESKIVLSSSSVI